MYYALDNEELKTLEKVSEITLTDYEVTGKFVPVSSLMTAIEDLLVELHKEEEKVADLENDINNYYELKEENYYE
jgi:aspartokinase